MILNTLKTSGVGPVSDRNRSGIGCHIDSSILGQRHTIGVRKGLSASRYFRLQVFKTCVTRPHRTLLCVTMRGHSLLDIAALIGYKTLQMTKNYAHLPTDHIKKVVQSMSKIIAH